MHRDVFTAAPHRGAAVTLPTDPLDTLQSAKAGHDAITARECLDTDLPGGRQNVCAREVAVHRGDFLRKSERHRLLLVRLGLRLALYDRIDQRLGSRYAAICVVAGAERVKRKA